MGLNGPGREEELLGDLGVRHAPSNESQHFAFARRDAAVVQEWMAPDRAAGSRHHAAWASEQLARSRGVGFESTGLGRQSGLG